MSKTHSTSVRRPSLRRVFLLALVPAVLLVGHLAKAEVVRVPTENGGTWSITITPADRIVAALDEPSVPVPENDDQVPTVQDSVAPQLSADDQPEFYESVSPEVDPLPQGDETLTPMPPAPTPPAESQNAVTEGYSDYLDQGIAIVPNHRRPSRADEYRRIYDSIPYSRTEYLANPSYRHDTAMELLTGIPRQSSGNYVPRLNESTPRSPLFLYNRYGGVGPYYGSGGVSSYHGGIGLGFRYVPQYAPSFRYFLPLEDLY